MNRYKDRYRYSDPRQRYLPMSMREMSQAECGYVAGMIDADGCISIRPPHGQTKQATSIIVINTDVEIVSTMLRLTNAGRITYHKVSNPKWAPAWVWTIGRKLDVDNFLSQLDGYSIKVQKELVRRGEK